MVGGIDPSSIRTFKCDHSMMMTQIRQVRFGSLPFSFCPGRPRVSIFRTVNNHATGVAHTFNPLFHPDGPTETYTVRGTKLVVLSAGSFSTPGILERPGICAKSILEGVVVKHRVSLLN